MSSRRSIHAGVVTTLRRCVKHSKLARPRYAPWPDAANGSSRSPGQVGKHAAHHDAAQVIGVDLLHGRLVFAAMAQVALGVAVAGLAEPGQRAVETDREARAVMGRVVNKKGKKKRIKREG